MCLGCLYSRPGDKHFIYIISVNPAKKVALQCHHTGGGTRVQRGPVSYPKSINLSFELEPVSNIYILDHSLQQCSKPLIFEFVDCNRCYSFTKQGVKRFCSQVKQHVIGFYCRTCQNLTKPVCGANIQEENSKCTISSASSVFDHRMLFYREIFTWAIISMEHT